MTFSLTDFVRESNLIEGIHLGPTDAEVNAHKHLLSLDRLTVIDIEEFVGVICPGGKRFAPLRRQPGMDVRVGNHLPPVGGELVETALSNLLFEVSERTIDPWMAHTIYENLHPFMDGNGRSGRAIWLWQKNGDAPRGFLHEFYYQTLKHSGRLTVPK